DLHGPPLAGPLRQLRIGNPQVSGGAELRPGDRHGCRLSAAGGGTGYGSLPALPAGYPDPDRGGVQRPFELRAQSGSLEYGIAPGPSGQIVNPFPNVVLRVLRRI